MKKFEMENLILVDADCVYGGVKEEDFFNGSAAIEEYGIVDGKVVKLSEVEDERHVVAAPEPNFGEVKEEDFFNGSAAIEEYGIVDGKVVKLSEVEDERHVVAAPEPNFAGYWYERNPSLYQFELQCYKNFKENYSDGGVFYRDGFDNQNRFCVYLVLPFKFGDNPWRPFNFRIVYEHDFPNRDSDGLFGGSIKIFPMWDTLNTSYEHLIHSDPSGRPYVCQTRSAKPDEVNGKKAMDRLVRWMMEYWVDAKEKGLKDNQF